METAFKNKAYQSEKNKKSTTDTPDAKTLRNCANALVDLKVERSGYAVFIKENKEEIEELASTLMRTNNNARGVFSTAAGQLWNEESDEKKQEWESKVIETDVAKYVSVL